MKKGEPVTAPPTGEARDDESALADVFRVLEPPPGGLDTLRARLHRRRRSYTARWAWGGALVATAATVLVVALWPTPPPQQVITIRVATRSSAQRPLERAAVSAPRVSIAGGVALGLAATPSETVSVAPDRAQDTVVSEVLDNELVAIYLVADLRASAAEEAPE